MRQLAMGIGAPETTWVPPDFLPDRLIGTIGLDTETCDLGLQGGGAPGWAWTGGGHLAGISLSADNWSGYLPVGHESGGNLDPGRVRRFLSRVLGREGQLKVGANLLYDLGWLKRFGVDVAGPFYDVQWTEALLDEHRHSFSLEAISKDYLGEGKDEQLLREAAAAWNLDPKADLWRLPPRYVGPYAEADASLPLRIREHQLKQLEAEDLHQVHELEHGLMPFYLDMRMRGIRLDLDRIEQLARSWDRRQAELIAKIKHSTGFKIDPWVAASIARALDAEGIECPLTPKTRQPSVTQDFLRGLTESPTAKMVMEIRSLSKLCDTFLRGQLLGQVHDGRVHGEFHPLRGEDGGTISGRGSMSQPNLQFMPKRTEAGRQIRRCFLPEEGCEWQSADYSQQEPRMTVHWAHLVRRRGQPLRGAPEAVERYRRDPSTSYHQLVADETGLPYAVAKALNLALTYGRGAESTAHELNRSLAETKEFIERYHESVPFVRELDAVVKQQIKRNGFIRTLSGRRCRFPFWEVAGYGKGDGQLARSREEALARFGQAVQRAWLHKGLNRLVQGSAADQMKYAMLAVHKEGLGQHVAVQVHDELGLTSGDRATGQMIAELMREAVKISVPSLVDVEVGPTWGDAK